MYFSKCFFQQVSQRLISYFPFSSSNSIVSIWSSSRSIKPEIPFLYIRFCCRALSSRSLLQRVQYHIFVLSRVIAMVNTVSSSSLLVSIERWEQSKSVLYQKSLNIWIYSSESWIFVMSDVIMVSFIVLRIRFGVFEISDILIASLVIETLSLSGMSAKSSHDVSCNSLKVIRSGASCAS